ncbi:multicopper oxidase family protein [Paenibacillus gansuensis]|uniref:Copper-containing nitrite reductase n=1 Tax=Paenibacillus gansuensis TaxID=306542 RepID=A0ABW5PLH0_9BACL
MYFQLFLFELLGLLLLLVLSLFAGRTASNLVFAPSATVLHKRSWRLMLWSVILTLILAEAFLCVLLMIEDYDAVFWKDRLFLHLPLAALPLTAVWAGSLPKLLKLRRKTASRTEVPPRPDLRGMAAEPGLVVPFRMTSVGAAAALYFTFVPALPFRWADVIVPLALYAAVWAALWTAHERRCLKAGDASFARRPRGVRALRAAAAAGAVLVVAGLGVFAAQASTRLPASMDMMAGVPDYGGGPVLAGHAHGGGAVTAAAGALTPVTELTGPRTGTPDRRFTLTAEQAAVRLSSGRTVQAWTFNGSIPGPELRMREGELVEVTLVNKDIEGGVTLHWHGLDVPNAEDGVAGATQNAVLPGQTHTYRFLAEQTGTFWYHTHQHSLEGVQKGLFGTLIVEPKEGLAEARDITAITHVWDDIGFAIGDHDTVQRESIAPGTQVRLRLINTDNWVRQKYTLTGVPFRVAAIDGVELNEPGLLTDTHLEVTTGGRYDLTFTMPETPVFLSVLGGKKIGILISPDGQGDIPAPAKNTKAFDPVNYGKPAATPFGLNTDYDREFTVVLDNKLGFYNGSLDFQYTMNGKLFPDSPMFMVREGDLVRTTIINRGAVDHPMHLHGHHVLVLSKNGKPVTGTPWWSDTLDVQPGDTYVVAFAANNPGIWMDHCHNLDHAAAGMSMHLMYEGVVTPFKMGIETVNHPE